MVMYDDAKVNKEEGFLELLKRGYTKAEVHFSGGNDEGGADAVIGVRVDGTEEEIAPSKAYKGYEYVGGKPTEHGWRVSDHGKSRPATAQEIADAEFLSLLEAPVYAEYHSFAGEFQVEGKVVWDTDADTVVMYRNEQVYEYQESERAF